MLSGRSGLWWQMRERCWSSVVDSLFAVWLNGTMSAVRDMVESLVVEGGDVVVVQSVIDQPTVAAWPDETETTQEAKLVGDGGFGLPDGRGEVADAEFARGEGGDDAEAGGIGERGEDVGDTGKSASDRERGPRATNRLDVNDTIGA